MSDEITDILRERCQSPRERLDRVLPIVHETLREIACHRLRREVQTTASPTTLVHEAYLRLARTEHMTWTDRCHFYSAVSETMRRILVDRARRRATGKRAHGPLVALDTTHPDPRDPAHLLEIDRALSRLEAEAPRAAAVAKLRYLGGFSLEETASCVGVSPSTVKSDWMFARAWLRREVDRLREPAF